jgi:hypothetical protein
MKIRAGKTLKYKKESKDPIQRAIKRESGTSKIDAESIHRPNSEIIKTPPARPSRPSVMLTALAKEVIVKAAKGI